MDFKNLLQNLSRAQKVTITFILQAIIIIVIIATMTNIFSKPKDRVDTVDNDGLLKGVPRSEIELYEQELWHIISENDDNVSHNIIKDVVIRPDSYSEEKQESGGTQVSFIIDIDSIQQSYRIILGWDKDRPSTPLIDCLPISEAKYKDSVCYGTYRSTYDLSLYLPYELPSEVQKEGLDYVGPELYIEGDERAHTITVYLNPCNSANEYRKKAEDYLKTIPKINDYKIEYIINDKLDVVCMEDLQ